MAENSPEDMKPEEKGPDKTTGKPQPKDEMSKTQEDAAKERTKGGYQ